MSSLRIASLQPSITLTLERLGRLDTLVACTRYCLQSVPELQQAGLTIVADSWSSTTEELRAARPNLVLASVPYRDETLAAILRTGTPVVTLAPHTLADVLMDIRLLAAIVDARAVGEALCGEIEAEIARVRSATASLPRPRMYCEEWGKPPIHSQPWVAELVEAAGGEFVGEPGKVTTVEAVAGSDPDVLGFAWCGAGDRVPLGRVVAKRGWQQLRAVRQGRVYCIPDEFLNTPAHTLLEGLHAIAGILHPEVFPAHPRVIALSDSPIPQ